MLPRKYFWKTELGPLGGLASAWFSACRNMSSFMAISSSNLLFGTDQTSEL